MKNLFALLIASLTVLGACKQQSTITLKNDLSVERTDEVIVLSRAEVEKRISIAEGFLPVFKFNGQTIPSQVDDLDGDGNWDEVVLVLDFGADEYVEAIIETIDAANYPEFEKRTNVHLGIKDGKGSYKEVESYDALPCIDEFKVIAQGEGVTWENDKIGFRVYFDCRNVKDLFGKLLPTIVGDKVHTPAIKNYHDLNDWGMDVLHCGSSLGSGGIALMKNDSLIRLGSTEVYQYQKISNGPFRAIFELRYSGWDVDGEMMEAIERITIYPGKYWFESDVTVTGCTPENQIVTGIVTSHLKNKEPFAFEAADFQCIGTHGVQSLNKDELGMAVIVKKDVAGKIGRTTDINYAKRGFVTVKQKGFSHIISETYYMGQKCESGVPAKHYFFSVWGLEKDQWKTEAGFKKYISEEAEKLSVPITIM